MNLAELEEELEEVLAVTDFYVRSKRGISLHQRMVRLGETRLADAENGAPWSSEKIQAFDALYGRVLIGIFDVDEDIANEVHAGE